MAKLQTFIETRPGNANNNYYNIGGLSNASSVLRFMRDKNGDELEHVSYYELPFTDVTKGVVDQDNIIVRVPTLMALDFLGKECPVASQISSIWQNQPDEWQKLYKRWKVYYFGGIVLEDGLQEEKVPANPLRVFRFLPLIYDTIQNAMVDKNPKTKLPSDDIFDVETGVNFMVTQSKKRGQRWADWSKTSFYNEASPVPEEILATIEENDYTFDLSVHRPVMPDQETLDIMRALTADSIAGRPYDVDAYGDTKFKPFKFSLDGCEEQPDNVEPVKDDKPKTSVTVTSGNSSFNGKSFTPADEILEKIRERKAALADDDVPF